MADTLDLPVIDLEIFFRRNDSAEAAAKCKEESKRVAESFYNYGILIVKDPRASQADNDV
jgi:hypothetical protein